VGREPKNFRESGTRWESIGSRRVDHDADVSGLLIDDDEGIGTRIGVGM